MLQYYQLVFAVSALKESLPLFLCRVLGSEDNAQRDGCVSDSVVTGVLILHITDANDDDDDGKVTKLTY